MPTRNQRRNIYVVGAQCTGKTTLVDALETFFSNTSGLPSGLEVFKPVIIREVARKVLRTHNFTREDIVHSPARAFELQKLILKAQLDAEETALRDGRLEGWLISDRSGLDPIVYAKCFVGDEAVQEMLSSMEWKSLEAGMKNGLVILCEAGCTWLIDDGTRLMPKDNEDWLRIDSTFRLLLDTLGIRPLVISKDMREIQHRVEAVANAWGISELQQPHST